MGNVALFDMDIDTDKMVYKMAHLDDAYEVIVRRFLLIE